MSFIVSSPIEIGQPQRSHRMRQPGHDGRVDVLDGRDTCFRHPDRRQQIRHQQRIDDEARAIPAAHHLLAQHLARELLGARGSFRRGDQRADQFDQRQHRHRVEEVQSQHSARILRRRSDFHDRDARRVRRQHRVGIGDHLVEFGEDLALDGFVFDDGLDDQLAIGQVGQVWW